MSMQPQREFAETACNVTPGRALGVKWGTVEAGSAPTTFKWAESSRRSPEVDRLTLLSALD